MIADGADNAAVHFSYMIKCALASPAPVEIAGVVTLHLFAEEGASSPRVMMLDWRHGIKNASLMPFSMARLLTLGQFVVIGTFWITTQTDHKESGLLVSDVNIRDAMSVPAAKRRLNVAVRRCMGGHPRMLGAVAYSYFFACMDSAFDDRNPKLTPLGRCALAMDCMIFLRWWYGWIEAAGKTKQEFISMQTFNAFMVKGNMLLLLVLLFERTPALRARAFAPWLLGSNPVEELLSEVFAFEGGNTGPTFAGFMRILQRWLHQNRLLSDPDVHLPLSFSKTGHCGTHYVKESGDQYVQPDYPNAAGLQALYAQRVALMRPVVAALGMAQALRDAGMWDEVPLEAWNVAVAAAASPEETQANQADAEQFEGLAKEAAAAATSIAPDDDDDDDDDEGEGAEGGEAEAEASEAAAAAAAATAAAAAAATASASPRWKDGDVYDVEAIMEHAPPGSKMGSLIFGEMHFRVKWAGAAWRAKRHWTWEPATRLVADNSEFVGLYCRAHGLKLPSTLQARVDAALAAYDARPEPPEGEKTRPARPASTAPIPAFDRAVLLERFTAPIGSEAPNTAVRVVQPAAAASGKQRAAFERMHVWNPVTSQMEHKQTVLARGEKQGADETLAPGRSKYKHGVRMAVRSEDDEAQTGFWLHTLYQQHYVPEATGARMWQSNAGPLLLEGVLEVGLARVLELRRSVGTGSVRHPRLSVKRGDADKCTAVVEMLRLRADGWYELEASKAPTLVSVDCLGCRVGVRAEADAEGGGDVCSALEWSAGCGGARIVRASVSEELFEGDAMQASTELPLQEMLVRHLQAELAARSVGIRGNKGLLQLRLHGLVVAQAAQAARQEWEADGGEAAGGEAGGEAGDGSSDESDEDVPLAVRVLRASAEGL